MKRSLGAIVAMSLLSGCRSPAPPNDPFLYRSTVPPPGTIAPPAAGTPYYSAPAAVPGTAAPAGIAPVAPITPAPAPLAPAPAPTGPPSKYSPPGGFNYQSSFGPPAALPATTAAPVSASAARPIDATVVAAGSWQSPKDTRAESSSAAQPITQQLTTQPRPDPSIVRIVEPTKPAVASGTDAAPLSNARMIRHRQRRAGYASLHGICDSSRRLDPNLDGTRSRPNSRSTCDSRTHRPSGRRHDFARCGKVLGKSAAAAVASNRSLGADQHPRRAAGYHVWLRSGLQDAAGQARVFRGHRALEADLSSA